MRRPRSTDLPALKVAGVERRMHSLNSKPSETEHEQSCRPAADVPGSADSRTLYEAIVSLATAARICERQLLMETPAIDELRAIVKQMIAVADDAVLLSKRQRVGSASAAG